MEDFGYRELAALVFCCLFMFLFYWELNRRNRQFNEWRAADKASRKRYREYVAEIGFSAASDYAFNQTSYIKNRLKQYDTRHQFHFREVGVEGEEAIGSKLIITSKGLGREVTITLMPTWEPERQLILEDRGSKRYYHPADTSGRAPDIGDLLEWVKHCMATPSVPFC